MATLSRALLDFLWQGAVAALMSLVVLHVTRKPGPRYLLLCSILGILAIAPFAAFMTPPNIQLTSEVAPPKFYEVVVLFWVIGAGLGVLHLLLSWLLLKQRAIASVDAKVEMLVRLWAKRLRVTRRVHVVLDSRFDVPCIAGITRLALYLPLTVVARLSPDQLDAIIVHELMHAKRYDSVINLCQTLVERVYFFHPAVWWISQQIRIEREHLCDDQVLRILPDRYVYASALAAVEELRSVRQCNPAVAAGGGELSDRIARVLQVQRLSRVVRHPIKLTTVACAVPILMNVLLSQEVKVPLPPTFVRSPFAFLSQGGPSVELGSFEEAKAQKAGPSLAKRIEKHKIAKHSRPTSVVAIHTQEPKNVDEKVIPVQPKQGIPVMPDSSDQATIEALPERPTTTVTKELDGQASENARRTLENAKTSIENAKKSIENADRSLRRTAYGQNPNFGSEDSKVDKVDPS